MNIKLKYGELTLIKSDSVIVHDNQPIKIMIDDEYTVLVTCADDASIPEQKIGILPNEKGIEISLVNFNNALGTATGKPIEFAKQNGNVICISLCVYVIGTAKIIHYNIYVKQ